MKGESKKEAKDNASRPDSDELNRQAQMNAVWQRIEKKARSQSKKKKLDREKLAFRIILPIFIIESIALVVLVVMVGLGFVGFSGKAPSARTVSVYNVCGQDIVDEYNNIVTSDAIDSSYYDKLNQIREKVDSLEHSDDDATCQYVIIRSSVANSDVDAAGNAFDKYQSLAEKGVYPNPNLMGQTSVESLRIQVDSLREDVETSSEVEPNGVG